MNSDTRIPPDSNTRDPNVGSQPGIRSDFVSWLDLIGFFDLGKRETVDSVILVTGIEESSYGNITR